MAAGDSHRTRATRLTTAAATAWLWSRGYRAIAREVGLSPDAGLCMPVDGRWRVDIAAGAGHRSGLRLAVVEVKGTWADWRREDPAHVTGKWRVQWGRLGIAPWLALGPGINPNRVLTDLPSVWGVLVCGADGTMASIRTPAAGHVHKAQAATDAAWTLARCATGTALPMMRGRSHREQVAAILRSW